MPDPRQMSGIPRPDPQLQNGVVTVRVIRGSFDNPVVSLTVELEGPSPVMRATTDDAGRAEFKGVPAGTRVKAVASVAGERIESQEFAMPGSGGIRLALVAAGAPGSPSTSGPPAAAPNTGPVQPGDVVLGEDSRFIFEMADDGLSVFYVLQITNGSSTAVEPSKPVVFELPGFTVRVVVIAALCALAALTWFLHPWLFAAASALVAYILHEREFRSQTLQTLTRRNSILQSLYLPEAVVRKPRPGSDEGDPL